ncbi:uncharacterized protein YcbK (DUF882 family) [Humitalea rosea]|uniref:Murein endopeptidase K n=1 Tax=Humitalea rosea TaxID=990373 RepID=A0A2W7KJM3_9PROT|nr:uncharacterized protein YcbK (DUF882 family) [Humitalea rosea]
MWFHRPACPCCTATDAEVIAPSLTRRGMLGVGTMALACAALPGPAEASLPDLIPPGPRMVRIRRMQTQETIDTTYFRDGRYVSEELARLNWVMRDATTDEVEVMDPRLFDVLFTVATRMGATESFDVISAYRAPEHNAARAQQSRAVSRVSLHMSGMAADCRLPGHSPLGMARLAAEMQLGGVGLYRRDGFIHLDCGRVRRW